MRVFIVRPFGTKEGIDFDRVQTDLIDPALKRLDIVGGTTGELLAQGNIRTDMFQQLLIADLVIADISIHNANVFYELGVRHALRDRQTVLIRSRADTVPFDLKTDRYLSYDNQHPAADIERLIEVLQATQDSQRVDSPIYQLLPDLAPTKVSLLSIVPPEFSDEVGQARATSDAAYLQLLSADVKGLSWEQAGWRTIGRAQIGLKDYTGARVTWESIRSHYDRFDVEANEYLATVYERLEMLVRSEQAIARVLQNASMRDRQLAEAYALKGRNAKTRWVNEWTTCDSQSARRRTALVSPFLKAAYDSYARGFEEDRRHYYSGVNALAMLSCWVRLAELESDLWTAEFEYDEEAQFELQRMKTHQTELAAGVRLAIASSQQQHARTGTQDEWADMSEAQAVLLTSQKPRVVAKAFRQVLLQPDSFSFDAETRQLKIYQSLGVFSKNATAAMEAFEQAKGYLPAKEKEGQAPHVLLFTGHRVDGANRPSPRFPNRCASQARELIRDRILAVKQAIESRDRPSSLLGMAGAASGGDILFHEVCQEEDIPTEILLACPKADYIRASVAADEGNWVERFKTLVDAPQAVVRFLNQDENFGTLSAEQRLPSWLREKKSYSIWERTNLWILYSGLQRSQDDVTLIALWNGQSGDGPGGTEDMVRRTRERGARFIRIDSNQLLEPS
ncbi:MAG: tetratricopeptide repeat-containing protein [Cyanobacteria bacterium P01_A01_bin.3]